MIAILELTYSNAQQNIEQLQTPTKGVQNNQKINNNRTTALEQTAALATGGLKCILLVPNIRPRSAVAEIQEMFSSHEGPQTNAMYHHWETIWTN